MAKATRSPVLGFNHNVRYHGRVYHVQTEDSGPGHTRVFTHLFFEGTIIASKRYEYPDDFDDDGVKAIMQGQHKAILKELKQGQYDSKIETFFASRGENGLLAIPEAPPVDAPAAPADVVPQWPAVADLPAYAGPANLGPQVGPLPVSDSYLAGQFSQANPGVQALDLDALPPATTGDTPMPEVIIDPAPPGGAHGVGVYSLRGRTTERPYETPAEGVQPRTSPPPPAGRAPVVVIRPPVRRPLPRPPNSTPPPGGVVVQRTVVVGVGGTGPGGQRPRRPRPAVPYVVKEGSHPILHDPRAAQVAPPIPVAKPQTPGTISDKSLDEVILAYLSQDNEPKP